MEILYFIEERDKEAYKYTLDRYTINEARYESEFLKLVYIIFIWKSAIKNHLSMSNNVDHTLLQVTRKPNIHSRVVYYLMDLNGQSYKDCDFAT